MNDEVASLMKNEKRLLPGEKLSPKVTDVGCGTMKRLLICCGEFALRQRPFGATPHPALRATFSSRRRLVQTTDMIQNHQRS